MPNHKIAIVKGDGIGVDVVNEGMKVLDALAPRYGITWDYTEFPWRNDAFHSFENVRTIQCRVLRRSGAP